MTTLQNLKQEIYRLCPELKKLSFGCEVRRFHNTPREFYVSFDKAIERAVIYRTGGQMFNDRKEDLEILGQPIQLNHILRASKVEVSIECFKSGNVATIFSIMRGTTIGATDWDLTKDLDGQSDEVVAFLSSVLIKEK